MSTGINRSSLQLYRDCLRVVQHAAARSPKGVMLRKIVRAEFEKNREVADAERLEALKSNAVRALTNYLVYESSQRDERIKANIKETDMSRRKEE